MAVRNPWVLPAVILILLAVLAAVVFASEAVKPGFAPSGPGTAVLHVPRQYATIQAAIDAANPGDVIQVAPGTYYENLALNKPVELVASRAGLNAANNITVLDGGNGQATIFIPAGLKQGPTLNGLVVRNSQVGIEARSDFLVEDTYFYGSQISVRYEAGSGGVNRANVYFNSGNDAVHVDDASVPLVIENNRFLYAGDDAVELDFPNAGNLPTAEVDLLGNLLIGSSQDGLKLVDYGTGPQDANGRIVVADNLIANNRGAGIGFMHSGNTNEDYSGVPAAEAVRVYNNTFYGNGYGLSGGENLVAFNNIIANSVSHGAWRIEGPAGSNSVIAYTLFWQNGVDSDRTTLGLGNIFGQDPRFTGRPGPGPDGNWGTVDDDFSGFLLKPGSPAIDRGVAQYAAANGEQVPATPLTGFVGAAPDLGWRESGNAVVPSTPIPAAPAASSAAPLLPSQSTPTLAAAGPVGTTGASPTLAPTSGSPTALPTGSSSTPLPTGSPTGTALATSSSPSPTATEGTPSAAFMASATTTATTPATPGVSITSIAPTTATAGQTVTVIVTGTGFQAGLAAAFQGGQGTPPQILAVQAASPTTVLMTVTALNSTTKPQAWDLRIDNPDGSSALLESAFTISP